jgi:hypothetical protein
MDCSRFFSATVRFTIGLFAMPLDDKYIEARRHRHGPVETYEIFVEDFNRIETEAEAIGTNLTFGSIWLSVAITCSAALPSIPRDWLHVFNAFLTFALVGYTLGVYFLIQWKTQKHSLKSLMTRIRASQIPQWGDEGEELKREELEELPSEEAPPHTEGKA